MAVGDRIVVGVSGGPDSTALLLAMFGLAPRLGLSVEAVTVDHGLRPEAREEAVAVSAWCKSLGIPWRAMVVDVGAFRGRHVSLQDAARRARLAALAEVAGERGRVALGHNADDQAETVLFRIVRGTGLRGLAGIPYRRDPFIRPLLDVRRREILAWLERRRVGFVEDPSNRDVRFSRARVRFEWLPMLERENPRVAEALLGLAEAARRQVGEAGRAQGGQLNEGQPSGGAEGLPLGGAGRAARATIERLLREGAGSHQVSVPGGTVELRYGRAHFFPGSGAREDRDREPAAMVEVAGPGRYVWPGSTDGAASYDFEVIDGAGEGGPPAGVAVFESSLFSAGPLLLRPPRPGDRMFPRGGVGSRKLSDLLIDAKIPRALRAGLPVLMAPDGQILFVPGLRPAERARPAPRARSWVEVRVRTIGACP